MTTPQAPRPPRYKTWAAWCLVVLLVPLTGASFGMLYALVLHVSTGKISTVAKGFGRSSQTVSFVDSPFVFLLFLFLTAALAACIIAFTIVCARLAYGQLRPRPKAP